MTKSTVKTSLDLAKSVTDFYMAAARQPDKLFTSYFNILQDSIGAFTGSSTVQPERGDKRFKDPIWSTNPVYKAVLDHYLSWSQNLNGWVESLDIEEASKLRAQILVSMLTDTLSPTNMLLGNPEAMKTTLEKGGSNLIHGTKHLIDDMIQNNGLPSMVDKSKFKVGENLGTTEGQVVFRNDILELIQYAPKTEKVFKRPVFIIPPQINKFYIWDLAPERSVVEYLLEAGHQVFIVSWRNPTSDHGHWGMDEYVLALDEASEVATEITNSKTMNFIGACSGGITASLLMAYWSAKNIRRAHSFTLLVAILDIEGANNTTMGLFANIETLELARLFSKTKGVLGGKDLQKAFAWLRPNDLIWAYWVNNYLLGKEPPAFDILFWNADTTNLPAALHGDMIKLMTQGGMKTGNSWTVNGVEVSLENVTCDKFVVGGSTDHITPWEGCYQSVHIFGGNNEFVLSQSGHIQAIINPPGNPKARYLVNTGEHATAQEFKKGAEERDGTWWDYWRVWLDERGGSTINAAQELGSQDYPPIMASPGSYVHQQV